MNGFTLLPGAPDRRLRIALLEHPRQPSWEHLNDIANAPLSSSLMTGYAASALEADGHWVQIVDANLGRLSAREAVESVAATRPDLVGVHLVYDWSDGSHVRCLLSDLQELIGRVPVILYGFYPTFAYFDLVGSLPGVVAAVLGEHEVTLTEAARAVAASRPGGVAAALESVAGLAIAAGGSAHRTSRRELVEVLDALPPPVRTREMLSLREVNLAGSRGCYGACSFCTINPFYGHASRWRPRSPADVIDEMEAVLTAHPEKTRFYFVDPNFFGPGARGRERVFSMARRIKERFSIRFGVEGRVNDIHEEVVSALVGAGFDEILIGLESGSNQSLARFNKSTTVAQNRRALEILRTHGVEPNVGFIMFEPESTLADVRVNLAFLEELELLSRLSVTANVLCHQQILLASTPAYRLGKEQGRLVLSGTNPYEGYVPYRHPDVAFLAESMAEVCRHIFAGLPATCWDPGVEGSSTTLTDLNDRLVELFYRLLETVESCGAELWAEVSEEVVEEMRRRVTAVRTGWADH